ncbi:MAG: L-threonylcarbamoyladenylate synthase [Firmicutes bacterium]|nr:L-threonylcarbamoyladenylate synthase [Bacillota bacterium]
MNGIKTAIGTKEDISTAVAIIKGGGVVAFPTETVYGLGANAFSEEAVKEIFKAKGRPSDNPLIVHIPSVNWLNLVAKNVPDIALKLFKKFSPGALALVLEKSDNIPEIVTAGLPTVAVRIPKHDIALKLIEECGVPISAPSANISGLVSPTKASHVFADFNGKIPLILDGGDSEVGIESTVLDLTKNPPIILRPGAITADMLLKVLPKVLTHKGEVLIAQSPGMKYKHYSPKCEAVSATLFSVALNEYKKALNNGKSPVIIWCNPQGAEGAEVINLGGNAGECMHNLFAVLREAEVKYNYIILQYFEESEREFTALNNRIIKAVNGVVLRA